MCCILLEKQNIVLAVDIMHGHGPSNKMHTQLQPKKTKVRLYESLIWQQKVLYVLYVINKSGCFCFKGVRRTVGEAFKRRLSCSVGALIAALNNFVPLLKRAIAEIKTSCGLVKNKSKTAQFASS